MRAFLLAAILAASPAIAGDYWRTGDIERAQVIVCLHKEDAIKIAKTHSKDGVEAANAVYQTIPSCMQPALRFRVGTVMFSVATADGELKVVEIQDPEDEKSTLYMLTILPVLHAGRDA